MANFVFTEASGVADPLFGKIQAPLHSLVEESFNHQMAKDGAKMLEKIYKFEDSTHAEEAYTGTETSVGMSPREENGVIPGSEIAGGPVFRIPNCTWSDSIAISWEALDDDMTGTLKRKKDILPRNYARTRTQFGAALLGTAMMGGKSVNFRGKIFPTITADGKPLFSTEHVDEADGKLIQCNSYSDPFSLDALTEAETEMQNVTNGFGEEIGLQPDTIVIPNIASIKKDVIELLGSNLRPEDYTNRWNFHCGGWDIVVWNALNRYITKGCYPWMIMDSQYIQEVPTLVFQDRAGLRIDSKVEDNLTNRLIANARWGGGFPAWKGVACGGMANGKALVT